MNEQQTKDLIQKLGAVRDQCSRKIERLKTQLKCPSNYHNECGKKGCHEPVYEFGLCFRHHCISESDTTYGNC